MASETNGYIIELGDVWPIDVAHDTGSFRSQTPIPPAVTSIHTHSIQNTASFLLCLCGCERGHHACLENSKSGIARFDAQGAVSIAVLQDLARKTV